MRLLLNLLAVTVSSSVTCVIPVLGVMICRSNLQVFLTYIRVLFLLICLRIVVGEFDVWLYNVVGGDV